MSIAVGHALPTAVLSGTALREACLRAHDLGKDIADLRADAAGHGLIETAERVLSSGMSGVLVDDEDDAVALRAQGISVVSSVTEKTASPEMLFGLLDAPVMRLQGRVLGVKALCAGEGVSYGYTYRAEIDTRIALVSGGYAQGLVRALGNRASVEIDGEPQPIVGRIAMDACVVDVGAAEVAVGDAVTFFGGAGPAASSLRGWSDQTGLTATELVTVIGQRVERIWED